MAKKVQDENEKKNPDMLSSRVGEALLAELDSALEGRVNEDGQEMNRTDATREALRAWISGSRAGVVYLGPREHRLIDGLRQIRPSRPEAADAVFDLGEAAIGSASGAEVLERILPLVRAFAARSQEAPRPAEDRGPRKRTGPRGQAGKENG